MTQTTKTIQLETNIIDDKVDVKSVNKYTVVRLCDVIAKLMLLEQR